MPNATAAPASEQTATAAVPESTCATDLTPLPAGVRRALGRRMLPLQVGIFLHSPTTRTAQLEAFRSQS